MAYASKYYDPVKRHEYYMKHRKLKGRQSRSSTASLNEEGKIAAKEVKEGIMAERKEAYEAVKTEMNKKIDDLRKRLKAMPKFKRAKYKEKFQAEIKALREEAKEKKAKIKEEYQEKYLQELDKIKQDASFAKVAKSRSGGSGKKRKKKR